MFLYSHILTVNITVLLLVTPKLFMHQTGFITPSHLKPEPIISIVHGIKIQMTHLFLLYLLPIPMFSYLTAVISFRERGSIRRLKALAIISQGFVCVLRRRS